MLRRALQDEWFPLAYDAYVEEVQLTLHEGGHAVVRWCPFCGREQTSGRGKLFTKVDPGEEEDVGQQLAGLRSLDAVADRLGRWDEEGTGCGLESRPWTRWARYWRRWKSLVLTVGEYSEGGISWSICGQWKGQGGTP
jgi:hypothetical protein